MPRLCERCTRKFRGTIGSDVSLSTAPPPATSQPQQPAPAANGTWCLYLIECRNGGYYAGITNRLDARYAAHVAGRGARYTRANPPLQLLGFRPYPDRASASRV